MVDDLSFHRERLQLSDEAASYIRDQITSGNWAPGTHVRPDTVASHLGMSATPAREALQSLRSEGFLELAPRRGFAVARVTGDDIRDMFVAQSFIACELAARTATTISPEGISRLEKIHEKLTAAAESGDLAGLEHWNHQFHREVNLAAGSPRLAWILRSLSRHVPLRFYAAIEGWPRTTLEDHGGLLEAIRGRDVKGARAEMVDHIYRAGELLASHVDKRLASLSSQPSCRDLERDD